MGQFSDDGHWWWDGKAEGIGAHARGLLDGLTGGAALPSGICQSLIRGSLAFLYS